MIPQSGQTDDQTVRLTTAHALVRWMLAQRSELLDGTEVPLFAGVFGIFGHGNVLGLGAALYEVRDELPTWRGSTEQGMALAAVAYTRATDRRQVMVATSSVGPGALNMVTAAGVAHANRLPVLLLPGDTFTGRAPDPVLQQVEHFGDPTTTVNDAFRPVSRYFDRITRPEQLISTLPQVARVLTDPADTGPVVLALPQDVQAERYDFPVAMFAPRVHRVPRARPDVSSLSSAADLLREAERPLLVLGGGVRYSGAGAEGLAFAETHNIPAVETVAGRTLVPHDHRLYGGPLGIIGSTSANNLAAAADVVLAVGTRLQDFTTASWTAFAADVRIITVNAARFDAVKHGSHAVVGDARETLVELSASLGGWKSGPDWAARAAEGKAAWDVHIDSLRAGGHTPDGSLTYAQVTGVVNDLSTPDDYVLTASGGMPGELHGGWRTGEVKHGSGPTSGGTMDLEYGFSCMGYEVVAPWGAAMARQQTHPDGLVTSICGDGSYLMLNSELYSAAFAGHPYVAVVCDNAGFAVIHRLQTNQGAKGFNNLLADSRGDISVRVDFVAHAASLGVHVEDVRESNSVDGLRAAYERAREAARTERRPAVVVCNVHHATWTEAGAWWETGVPESLSGRASYDEAKQRQLRWLG
ncbi:3D-(3,5/4)-trihydroxycyclohexane-1,2-dione acylhydrolase (decyclizing) [Nocardioides immobilis]|uniref:3D-(3,5/4)-trihydroxycyclohexane-1,2-dione acylhydrolase (Decyclizing) n=1 Tax=Nocardioides immobilis TaxID=2049295 RepID=A0A417Y6N0_9ACTN|nr:3D-(3,5/4)-trihydroxycyclohexane-1,2-dione acylhydrolase (decyclizing) [Nocardioides immobilis]RHW28368.1 3D-(3,5/4)-trihydroxycyclohexane-1,2-dione acylhydrolase (decyclizing) [Nocardioides immobilis]